MHDEVPEVSAIPPLQPQDGMSVWLGERRGSEVKLDLGCGCRLNPGHTGVDYLPLKTFFPGLVPPHYEDHFIEFDLYQFPWPFESSSVEDVIMRHFVNLIPHRLPRQERDPLASRLD